MPTHLCSKYRHVEGNFCLSFQTQTLDNDLKFKRLSEKEDLRLYGTPLFGSVQTELVNLFSGEPRY